MQISSKDQQETLSQGLLRHDWAGLDVAKSPDSPILQVAAGSVLHLKREISVRHLDSGNI